MKVDKANARCETDLTDKTITPLGGFVRYGVVREDFLLLKGSVPGPIKRVITLRKALRLKTSKAYTEQISIKFIDTSSKFGHGKFQVCRSCTARLTLIYRLKRRRENSWGPPRRAFCWRRGKKSGSQEKPKTQPRRNRKENLVWLELSEFCHPTNHPKKLSPLDRSPITE